MGKRYLIFLIFGLLIASSAACAQDIKWINSYDQALNLARAQSKPIMVDFYTEWCGWCKRLDQETYKDQRVAIISMSFICLKIDGDKNSALVQKYNVSGYPTILFLDPSGKVIGGGPGYRDGDTMLNEMNVALQKTAGVKPAAKTATTIPAPSGKVIKSSVSSIGAFAKNWPWSKERNQDGEYAETKVSIKPPQSIRAATLVLKHNYSQKTGTAPANVYLSAGAQVAPKDDKHYKGHWWVGEGVKLGPKAGSFETRYSQAQPSRIDITGFVRQHPSGAYYIAVQNLSGADIGVGQIYIEIEE